jgi:hypothetical protein
MTAYYSRKGVEVKVGDKVTVIEKWSDCAGGMGAGLAWRNVWVGEMNKYIGNTVKVSRIGVNGFYFKGCGGLGFPTMSVEHFETVTKVSQFTFFDTRLQARNSGKQVYDAAVTGTPEFGAGCGRRWFVKT